jgi:hypothetical protein
MNSTGWGKDALLTHLSFHSAAYGPPQLGGQAAAGSLACSLLSALCAGVLAEKPLRLYVHAI